MESLLALLQENGPRLFRLFVRLTLSNEAAEDLMQELFLKLWQSDGFSAARDPAAYAYRTAIHLAFDWRRNDVPAPSHVPQSVLESSGPTTSPLADLVKREEIEVVLNALSGLSDKMRDAVVMRHIQQESYETIARHLETTPHQVRSLCHKAVCKVRDTLAPECS